jgi:hypothetical protein
VSRRIGFFAKVLLLRLYVSSFFGILTYVDHVKTGGQPVKEKPETPLPPPQGNGTEPDEGDGNGEDNGLFQ